jgi:hypothetical protein
MKSKLQNWYTKWLAAKVQLSVPQSPDGLWDIMTRLRTMSLNTAAAEGVDLLLSTLLAVRVTLPSSTVQADQIDRLMMLAPRRVQQDGFYGRLDALLEKCLGKDPDSRKLDDVMQLLQLENESLLRYL